MLCTQKVHRRSKLSAWNEFAGTFKRYSGSDKDLNSETVSNAILSQKKICSMCYSTQCPFVGEERKKLTKKDQFQLKKHYAEIIQNTHSKSEKKWQKIIFSSICLMRLLNSTNIYPIFMKNRRKLKKIVESQYLGSI